MKKNGYLRKFIAMFLVFVMLMADSSMTTFAQTVGRVREYSADQGVAVQSGDDDVALFSDGGQSITNGISEGSVISVDNFDVIGNLGEAQGYGVIANKVKQTGDVETNYMVGEWNSKTNDLGTSYNYGTGGNNYIGNITGTKTLQFHSDPANLFLGDEAYELYKNKELTLSNVNGTEIVHKNIDVETIISNIEKEYQTLFDKKDANGNEPQIRQTQTGSQKMSADITSNGAGVYLTNYYGSEISDDKMDISLNANTQKLVINIRPSGNTFKMGRFNLNGSQAASWVGNTNKEADEVCSSVVFNFGNWKGTIDLSAAIAGVVIAPNAHFYLRHTSGGILVCDSMENGGEWHYHNHELPQPRSFTVEKKWNVKNGSSYPDNVTVQLYRQIEGGKAEKYGNAVILTKDKKYKYTWENLDKNDSKGNKYTYFARELDNVGNAIESNEKVTLDNKEYTVSYDENGSIVTNTENDESGKADITFSGKKSLTGKTLEDGQFTFELQETDKDWKALKGAAVQTAQNGKDGKFSFEKIEYSEAGTHYYTVKEQKGGTSENGITYDGKEYRIKVTVSDNGDGTLTASADQDVDVTALDFNNTYTASGSVSFGGSKLVNGTALTDAQKASLAGKVSFGLYRKEKGAEGDASPVDESTLGKDGTFAFDTQKFGLADAGKTYEYQIRETKVDAAGYGIDKTVYTYEVAVTDGGNGSLNVAVKDKDGKEVNGNVSVSFNNTYTASGSTDLKVTKKLTGREFKEGDNWTFTVTSKPEGAPMPSKTSLMTSATSGDSQDLDFGNIKYTLADAGKTYVYTITESGSVSGVTNDAESTRTVTVTISDKGDGTLEVKKTEDSKGMTFTNSYGASGSTDLKVTKELTGREFREGDDWTFTVTCDTEGAPMPEETSLTTSATSGNSQELDFGKINYTLADAGKTYVYTITESGNVSGVTNDAVSTRTVTVTISDNGDGTLKIDKVIKKGDDQVDNVTFTNTYETTSVSGTKTWSDNDNQDGKRPDSITVNLLADGTVVATKTVTADSNWTYSFTNLQKYKDAGQLIVYTVTEDEVAGYTSKVTGNAADGFVITNTHTPETTSISGTKTWADNNNQDGKRPESITVNLLVGETVIASQTVTAATNWNYTFENLPVYANGQKITYTITEGAVANYTTEINGYDIKNTHIPETTSVEGQKVWDDADNQDGVRPDSITVRLLANGTEVKNQTVTAATSWAYSFTDLPKYANGKEIVYTVTEDAVANYTTDIDGTTITNSYTPGKTSVTVTKAWVDNDDQDGIRPDSIKVQLYAGDAAQGEEVALSAENKWTYTWTDLDEKKDGQSIAYTVKETEVPAGYEVSVAGNATEGFSLTNTHQTEVTSVEGTKTWNDNDQTAKRPESITVRLLADGKEVNSQKVTAESGWTYKFADLPKYAEGKAIVYTVSEDAVPGYLTSVSGNNLINTITSVKVSKVDITDHKELSGAHIQVIDKDGNIIDEWDSTWEAHEVTGLKTGEKYTLRETVAPDGYTVTNDTTFSLKEDGTVDKDNTETTVSDDGTLLVEDSKTSVKVSKVDIADGKELEGAHIQIIDEDDNIVDEWDSTKEAHEIKGLKTGKKYILRETAAPTGYELTNDTTFVLKADGTVDTENTTTVSKDGVLLVQDKLATGQSIAVTKRLTTITGDLRAMDQTFYVALYSDEACTQRVSDVKAIEFKNASSSTVVFNENIEVNKQYYIAECAQDGTAQSMGALADGTLYEAKFNEGNTATVKEANGTTTVYFDNVFSSLPDGFYKEGKLTITKKLLGADGNAKKSSDVFYAGIFDDADHTKLSTQVSQNIVKLDLAGGSEVSQVIKIGLDENKAVTLYVTETDSNGKPVDSISGFAYKVSVDGSTVTIDEANENASVTITNTENPTTTKTTTEESEETGSSSSASSHSMSSSTKAPKTGDDTPIAMYLVILLIAAAVLSVFGYGKLRRRNRK